MDRLHPIEAFGVVPAFAGDIRVEKLEDRLAPTVHFPHKHNFFQILYVTQGSGWHEIDFVRHKTQGHEIFVMKPAQVHSWNFHRNTKGWVIEFTNESFGSLVMSLDRVRALPDLIRLGKDGRTAAAKAHQQINNLCEQMYEEFVQRRESHQLILQTMTTLLFAFFEREAGALAPHLADQSILDKLNELIEKNYRQQHEVLFYSEKLHLSPKALSMRTLRLVGKSARDIIFERILLEAKRKLAYSDEVIYEIGHQLGFEDPNYFSRFFKTQAGVSPAEFRREQRALVK